MQYCTVAQVKQVAKLASQEYNGTDPNVDAEISLAIDEATSIAKGVLQGRYSIATIDADVPTDVNSFTKIKAAMIYMTRVDPAPSENMQNFLDNQKKQAMGYEAQMLYGDLRDSTGAVILARLPASTTLYRSNSGITGVFS
jgi:hypothetical protein